VALTDDPKIFLTKEISAECPSSAVTTPHRICHTRYSFRVV